MLTYPGALGILQVSKLVALAMYNSPSSVHEVLIGVLDSDKWHLTIIGSTVHTPGHQQDTRLMST
jgi:hypothetical protein